MEEVTLIFRDDASAGEGRSLTTELAATTPTHVATSSDEERSMTVKGSKDKEVSEEHCLLLLAYTTAKGAYKCSKKSPLLTEVQSYIKTKTNN